MQSICWFFIWKSKRKGDTQEAHKTHGYKTISPFEKICVIKNFKGQWKQSWCTKRKTEKIVHAFKCVCLTHGEGWKGDLYDMDEKNILTVFDVSSQKQRKIHIWKKYEKSHLRTEKQKNLENVEGLTWMVFVKCL